MSADEALFAALRAAASETPVLDGDLPQAGEMFASYQLLRSHFQGGQGSVFEALDASGVRRAVKVYRSLRSVDRRRVARELALTQQLHHPYLVGVLEQGVEDGLAYSVMEWVDGHRLDQILPRLQLQDRLDLFEKICAGVHHAHQQGVVHRDLKPANVLVTDSLEPRIVDFGIAGPSESLQDPITATGELLGTLAYAAPEQLANAQQEVRPSADVYSLGVLLFELVTDELPIPLEGGLATLVKTVRCRPPRDARRLNPAVDARLASILRKALAKLPGLRHSSVNDLAEEVGRWRSGLPTRSRGSQIIPSIEMVYRWRRELIVAGLAVLVVAAAWSLQHGTQSNPILEQLLLTHSAAHDESDLSMMMIVEELERSGEVIADPKVQARLRIRAGNHCRRFLWHHTAEKHFLSGVEILRGCSPLPREELAGALTLLGEVQIEVGRRSAMPLLQQALELQRERQDSVQQARVLALLARVHRRQTERPRRTVEQLLGQALDLLTPPGVGRSRVLGLVHLERALLGMQGGDSLQQVADHLANAAKHYSLEPPILEMDLLVFWLAQARWNELLGYQELADSLREAVIRQVPLLYEDSVVVRVFEQLAGRQTDQEDAAAGRVLLDASLVHWLRNLETTSTEEAQRAHELAGSMDAAARWKSAYELFLEILGSGAYEITRSLGIACELLFQGGQSEEAKELAALGMTIECRSFGADCPYRVVLSEVLGKWALRYKAYPEAIDHFERSFSIRQRQGWDQDIDGQGARLGAAEAALQLGLTDRAQDWCREYERVGGNEEIIDASLDPVARQLRSQLDRSP